MIELVDVSKSYRKNIFGGQRTEIVKDVSFRIQAGETLGLIGASGCGKTTLAKIATRLIKPTTGQIKFDGADITTIKEADMRKKRQHVQIMFQNPESALNPRIKIYDSIAEIMRIHKIHQKNSSEERKKVKELIEIVGLQEEHLLRYPGELSGGQVQRAVLARVLSIDPKFIVADEPTSMLDVSVQAQILKILKTAQKEYHFACLFISHNIGVVKAVSDRIAVMNEGVILESGVTDEVIDSPKTEFTKALMNNYYSDFYVELDEVGKQVS
ncbi:dipeptide/oligopeptide/nickel ABC transporter ATP-binding protein [Acetobacterium wieringae]|uniref:Dipeptide/oligopeptide/nickel ABC transporter ATP-binding protein n=1 Tax=Acetobacterium wieringae TaxID=52694 RepID=A0ABY6HDB4_9FIRM|nr:dipeptide/oligopeptide/nickel ABC transporter ATP-binding protein [Acetobacterium wieringae]UYO62513.1 dipeptide/oligopeptide/nickel ABC transporter ATP-binding protein [Acetobacterium wieringae]VUZ23219.1 Oligopeptide transport ATP-binding protein OppF [Acetobacterium wieringae]